MTSAVLFRLWIVFTTLMVFGFGFQAWNKRDVLVHTGSGHECLPGTYVRDWDAWPSGAVTKREIDYQESVLITVQNGSGFLSEPPMEAAERRLFAEKRALQTKFDVYNCSSYFLLANYLALAALASLSLVLVFVTSRWIIAGRVN